jgi:hypothetical protein
MYFLFNRTTLQVFVTYLTGALYVHPLWFYKYQHDNRVRSKMFVACQRWWFQWQFADILVNCAPGGEMLNYCTPHIIKENFENVLIHQCSYVPLSQVYCIWQVVKIPTINYNNSVYLRNFPTEELMKYTSIFVILRCCPIKIYYFSSWYNEATVSDTAGSTAGTNF